MRWTRLFRRTVVQPVKSDRLNDLQQRLGYHFAQPALLLQALTHRSFSSGHNERLEFLGDAILNFVVAEALFRRFPDMREGDLSRLRAQLVKGETLARFARHLGLNGLLVLGEGELKTGGQERPSILADALEAILGALYLEAGLDTVRARIVDLLGDEIAAVNRDVAVAKDPKTQLQEWLQGQGRPLPYYSVIRTEGDAHNQRYTVACAVAGVGMATEGAASSRKLAEKRAAEAMLQHLAASPVLDQP
jgi:ribonuclease III